MSALRDRLAAWMRATPPFRGKARVGALLTRLFTNLNDHRDCQVRFPLRDGSVVAFDLRHEPSAFWTGEYDYAIIQRLLSRLGQGSVAFDVGGNVGLYAVQLARHLQQVEGTLYVFEPVPANMAELQRLLRENGVDAVARPLTVALGDEEGEIRMRLADSDHPSETGNAVLVREELDGCRTTDVASRITRLDTLAAELQISRCDLIKIDIEGAELMFLQGGAEFLQRHRPVIFGEFNAFHMERFGCSFADVAALTGGWGYRFYRYAGPGQFREVTQPGAGLQHMLLVHRDLGAGELRALGIAG